MLLRGIVFEVNFGQLPLQLGQDFILINFVVLAMLKQNHVKIEIFHLPDGHIVHVVPQSKPRARPP